MFAFKYENKFLLKIICFVIKNIELLIEQPWYYKLITRFLDLGTF